MKTHLLLAAAVSAAFFTCTIFTPNKFPSIPAETPSFDLNRFKARDTLAASLYFDDLAAWKSSDSILAQKNHSLDSLDKTWFVYTLSGKRSVFYGRYFSETNTYVPKYSFEVRSDFSIFRKAIPVDDTLLRIARSVYTGINRLEFLLDSLMLDFKFNHYIRMNSDQTFNLLFLPAGMDNYCGYGLEIAMLIDASGTTILEENITGNELKYFEVKMKRTMVNLDNTYDDVPSVGNIFFVRTFGRYFGTIVIKNRNSTSIATFTPNDSIPHWNHTLQ